MIRRPPSSTLFPSAPLFRSGAGRLVTLEQQLRDLGVVVEAVVRTRRRLRGGHQQRGQVAVRARVVDRKSTRLNSSHANISYAVFCLKNITGSCHLILWHVSY